MVVRKGERGLDISRTRSWCMKGMDDDLGFFFLFLPPPGVRSLLACLHAVRTT